MYHGHGVGPLQRSTPCALWLQDSFLREPDQQRASDLLGLGNAVARLDDLEQPRVFGIKYNVPLILFELRRRGIA